MIRAIAWKRPHLTLIALAASAGAALAYTGVALAGATGPETPAIHGPDAAEPGSDPVRADRRW